MKRNKLFIGLILTVMIFGSTASAVFAKGDKMLVTIPFDFYANNQKMESGEYEIKNLSATTLILRSVKTGRQMIAASSISLKANDKIPERIMFNQYGENYVLRAIYNDRSAAGKDLGMSKTERKFRKESEENAQLAKNTEVKQVSIFPQK